MKKIFSFVLAAALSATLFTACGIDQTSEKTENFAATPDAAQANDHGDFHPLYFRDSFKSEKVTATFINSLTRKSEEVEMVRCGEDGDAYTFSCEGNVKDYNVAYFTYDGKKTKEFTFNRCVSG